MSSTLITKIAQGSVAKLMVITTTMFTTISVSTICGSILYLYRDEIKNFLSSIYECMLSYISCSLVIDKSINHKITYAITKELEEIYINKVTTLSIGDGNNKPMYKLVNGYYYIKKDGKKYCIHIMDDKIEIFAYFVSIETMKDVFDQIYQKHITTTNVLTFYLSEKTSWTNPIFRRPRQNMKMTDQMNDMLMDIESFYSQETEQKFLELGKPYRRGYLIHGPSGTGKTSIIEKIAMINDMEIYQINFNSVDMTDTNLINLVANVPVRSLIVIDEIDKQYDAIKKNKNVHISTNGILTALDGPQRLSHGTIIVIIANDLTDFESNFYMSLVRPGRIDKILNFTECL